MPLYDYNCSKCGQYEVTQRITEPAFTTCPQCGSKKVQRLITGGSFSLKGGGWYADLYSGASNKRGGGSGSGKSSST